LLDIGANASVSIDCTGMIYVEYMRKVCFNVEFVHFVTMRCAPPLWMAQRRLCSVYLAVRPDIGEDRFMIELAAK
jgi:hypothetical protein